MTARRSASRPAGRLTPLPVNLTDASTITTDASQGTTFRVTIAASRTLAVPTNPEDGQRATWEVTASGGPWILTLTTGTTGAFKYGTDFTSIPSIVAGTTTFIGAVYRSSVQRWSVVAVTSGH